MSGIFILSTGTELSSGNSPDLNGPHIARRLNEEGFEVNGILLLPDDATVLTYTIRDILYSRKMSVIMTGGLGPTEDDLTLDILASLFQKRTVEDPDALQNLLSRFDFSPGRTPLDMVRRQVRVIEGANVLQNAVGLAPGMLLQIDDGAATRILATMPGFPQEMRPMLDERLIPELKRIIPPANLSRVGFNLYGISEARFQKQFIETHSLPSDFRWGVTSQNAFIKVFFESADAEAIRSLHEEAKGKYSELYLPRQATNELHDLLLNRGLTLAGAESCTGGLIGKLITDMPNCSPYFLGSAVTYANEAKTSILGVSPETLTRYGAVSEQCALEMARGARRIYGSDIAFSVTGIAGPGGGSEEKPVGTVHCAFTDGKREKVIKLLYPFDRERIRMNTAHTLIFQMIHFIGSN